MSSDSALEALCRGELVQRPAHEALASDVVFLLTQLRGERLRALHASIALSCAKSEREALAERLRAFEDCDDALVRRQVRWARSRLGAQVFEPVPLEPEPQMPIPYLGEHVRYFSEPATERGADARREFEADVWLAGVADVVENGQYEEDVDAFEADALKRLDLWKPDVVVLSRTKATLVIWDSLSETEVERVIQSDDRVGFRMGALLHRVQLEYDEAAHANDRIFEGLRRVSDGVFRVVTGS